MVLLNYLFVSGSCLLHCVLLVSFQQRIDNDGIEQRMTWRLGFFEVDLCWACYPCFLLGL